MNHTLMWVVKKRGSKTDKKTYFHITYIDAIIIIITIIIIIIIIITTIIIIIIIIVSIASVKVMWKCSFIIILITPRPGNTGLMSSGG